MAKKKIKAPTHFDLSIRKMGKTEKKLFKLWLGKQTIRGLYDVGTARFVDELAVYNGLKYTNYVGF